MNVSFLSFYTLIKFKMSDTDMKEKKVDIQEQ